MGAPPLESIVMFVGGVASAAAYDLVKASLKAAVSWSRERIRRQPDENELPDGRPVHITLYGPKGEMLKQLEVRRESIEEQYIHPSIDESLDR